MFGPRKISECFQLQKQLQHFFHTLQKHYQLPILGNLDMFGHFYKK